MAAHSQHEQREFSDALMSIWRRLAIQSVAAKKRNNNGAGKSRPVQHA
jgi:hypothetical protein